MLRCEQPAGGHLMVFISACGLTGPGQCRRVAGHASAPADHLQLVQTSCSQAGERTAVCSGRHLLQLHQLPDFLQHTVRHTLRLQAAQTLGLFLTTGTKCDPTWRCSLRPPAASCPRFAATSVTR